MKPHVIMDGNIIKEVKTHKHLGMIFSNTLSWNLHIDEVCIKCKKRLDVMKSLKFKINRKSLEMFYNYFIRPILEYGNVLFVGSPQQDLNKLNLIEKESMRIVTGATARCKNRG